MNELLRKDISSLTREEMRKITDALTTQMLDEFSHHIRNGIYAKTQTMMAYNSNRIEGNTLSEYQIQSLFDTGTILASGEIIRAKDIEETNGHFLMFIEILKSYNQLLNENLIKRYHYCLKAGVFADAIAVYPCGEYKNRTNTVRGIVTAKPDTVHNEMIALLSRYPVEADMESFARFHSTYEKIHPFQDGNGRTGRAILFKECLRTGQIPVIVLDSQKEQYYEALYYAQKKDDISLLCSFFRECQRKYYEYVREYLYDYAEKEKYK